MSKLHFCFASVLVFSSLVFAQSPRISACVALVGKDALPDTAGRLIRDLSVQSSKSGIPFVGIPIVPSANSGAMPAAHAAGCKYLVSLHWVDRESMQLTPFPSPVAGINGAPVNQVSDPSHQALFATPASIDRKLLSYSIMEVPNQHNILNGMFLPSGFGADRCKRLASLIWNKMAP